MRNEILSDIWFSSGQRVGFIPRGGVVLVCRDDIYVGAVGLFNSDTLRQLQS